MKPSILRRIRRRTASHETGIAKKDNKQEPSFFGEASQENFFQPAAVVQRKCETCEEEDKKVHRQPEKKEEDKQLMRAEDKKEEEKVMRAEEKKEEEKPIQKKESGPSVSDGKSAGNYISSLNGRGNPLPAKTNHFFSARMGYDFSNVKIHTDKAAAESAKDVNARAYAVGNNIVFNNGQYDSESIEGKRLIAHELAHVVQQDPQRINRKNDHTFWFKDPAKQQVSADEEHIETSAEARERVFIENSIQPIADAKANGIEIKARFAYPSTEMSTQPSKRIQDAKGKIATIIASVLSDLNSLPPAADAKARAKDESVRAKLKEAIKSKDPINIFIQTDPSDAEMKAGMVAAYTDRVFINIKDVGNDSKLKAAISVPVMMVTGGVMPAGQDVPVANDDEFKSTFLHESLHRMLIERSIDAEAVYQATKKKRKLKGDEGVKNTFEALMADFFVAQEEVFVYSQIEELYPSQKSRKGDYETFLVNINSFLTKRKIAVKPLTEKIDVSEKVNKKKVIWSIAFLVPEGTVEVADTDKSSIDFLKSSFPH